MSARRSYTRHGLTALKAKVKMRGLAAIDRRSAPARALIAWRREMVADLGGEGQLSAQQLALIDLATRTRLYVESLDAWLMEQPSLILKRRRAVLPVLRERQQLADSLARLLGQLGLERRAKSIPTLNEYLTRGGSRHSLRSAAEPTSEPTAATIAAPDATQNAAASERASVRTESARRAHGLESEDDTSAEDCKRPSEDDKELSPIEHRT